MLNYFFLGKKMSKFFSGGKQREKKQNLQNLPIFGSFFPKGNSFQRNNNGYTFPIDSCKIMSTNLPNSIHKKIDSVNPKYGLIFTEF